MRFPAGQKPPQTHSHLQGINSGVVGGQTGVGNMHVSQFQAAVVFLAKEVSAQRNTRREIFFRRERGYLIVGEQRSPTQLNIGSQAVPRGKVPLEIYRVNSKAIGGISGLKHQEGGDCVERRLETALQKSGAVRTSQDPTVPESQVPDAGITGASAHRVASATPYLDFAPAVLGTVLRVDASWQQEQE